MPSRFRSVCFLGALICKFCTSSVGTDDSFDIPEHFCSSFGAYPNPLHLTEEDRKSFHPVVKFPMVWSDRPDLSGETEAKSSQKVRIPNVVVNDHSVPTDKIHLAREEQREERSRQLKNKNWFQKKMEDIRRERVYSIGRYDEDRVAMYISSMFQDTERKVDGYAGARTIRIGIDLAGPVGTKVFAFTDGIIHSAGYNPELGDYGNVIVVEHCLPSYDRKVWALYGHLDGKSTQREVCRTTCKKRTSIGETGRLS
jgi:murein DD-endopeptidase MepM/ murein hydrolase activator NlpD